MKLFENLRGDVFGGLTTSVVSLPLAIAFGVAAFAPLGPEYIAQGALAGLYAAIFAGAVASIFGGTPAQISGPTAPMSVIATSVIVKLMKDPNLADLDLRIEEVVLVLVMVTIIFGGIFQMLLGAIGGGKLIKFIPYPVVAGFMNGIAVLIFLAQLRPFFGVEKSASLGAAFVGNANILWETIAVGVITILGMVLGARFVKALPAALVALVAGVAGYFIIGSLFSAELLQLEGNRLIIGPIPSAMPGLGRLLRLFSVASDIPASTWATLLIPAATLGVLAAIDTLLTSVVADVITKTKHRSNKELVGQGIGNVTSAVFGGLSAAGSTVVTLVNVNAGGRTPLSGIVKSTAVLLAVLVLGQLVQWIPMAVLAGILLVTAVKMVDYGSLNLFKKKSAVENLVVMLAVTIITVSVDLMVAVGIGLLIASFLFVKEQIGKTIVRRKYAANLVHSKKVRDRENMQILEEKGQLITVYELSGSLFFGTCDKLFTEIEHDFHSLCIILDLKRVNTIDLTGAHLIRQIIDRVQENGNHLVLSNLDVPGDPDKPRLRRFMEDVGLTALIGEDLIFADTDRALEWAEDILIDREKADMKKVKERLAIQSLGVFKDMSHAQLCIVERYLQPRPFRKSEIVFNEGDPGDGMYFILSGIVSVWTSDSQQAQAHRLATFAEGVFFGDMAILEGQPRSATVRAETDTDLLFMAKKDFQYLIDDEPAIASHMLSGIARELSYRLRVTTAEVRALSE